jgi:hypothetical protein
VKLMRSNYVPLAIKNAGVELEVIVPEVIRRPPVLTHYMQVARLYRRVATGILLSSGHPRGFYANLFNSSRAFLHFLNRATDDQKVTSKAEAFFDAVTCRDESGAQAMARLSRHSINPGKEYEEDFIYVSLLMRRFYLAASATELQSMLQEWETYAADNPDPRLDVCRALIEADAPAFRKAVSTAIDAKVEEWERLRETEMLHPDEASTTCRVSTEVLAWVEFADRVGLKIEPEYRLAPSLARHFDVVAFPGEDAWQRPSGFSSLRA